MRDLELGRLVRVLRRKRGWRQQDCAVRARVHRSTWSHLERGLIDGMALRTLRSCLAVVEVRLDLAARWRGSGADQLLDADHAALQAAWVERLRRWGWMVNVEVSFNHFGDRGRVDLLAWHAAHPTLLVGEIKSDLVDAQELIGALDVKVRLGPQLAASQGWGAPTMVVPLLLIRSRRSVRDRLARLDPLFANFVHRGRAAVSCLRHPKQLRGGMLIISDLHTDALGRVMRVGGERVRLRRDVWSVDRARAVPPGSAQ